MVLHFLDISTLSLESVLDVNHGDLVDFFKIQPLRSVHSTVRENNSNAQFICHHTSKLVAADS